MDSGARQKQRAVSVKEEIKRNIAREREKAHGRNEASSGVTSRNYDVISEMTIENLSSIAQSTASMEPEALSSNHRSQQISGEDPSLLATLPWSHHQHRRSETLEQASPSEWNFVMKYLDFVFPALFPFYQPHIFDTGRSWLLILLKESKIAYHATLSLSCYYFTMALSDADVDGELALCKQLRWKQVEGESERCFASLRSEIVALANHTGSASTSFRDKVEIMNSITQVIIFEMMMGKAAPWKTHLPAVISLFEGIMTHPDLVLVYRGQPQSKFASVLLGLGEPLWTNPSPSNHIWSPVQAGFRFYAGLLVFIDIIASTAIGQTPRLLGHHQHVLATDNDHVPLAGEAEVRLSGIVGCPNWIARSIASMLSTRVWKQASPSEAEMSGRCAGIGQELDKGIDTLTGNLSPIRSSDSVPDGSNGTIPLAPGPKPSTTSIFALIWALATRLYLSALLNKTARGNISVQADVAHVLVLLKYVQPSQLRSLAWPIFVGGCLAADVHEPLFRQLLAGLSRTDAVGALKDVYEMLEQVWTLEERQSNHEVDITSCFAVLGSPVLLV